MANLAICLVLKLDKLILLNIISFCVLSLILPVIILYQSGHQNDIESFNEENQEVDNYFNFSQLTKRL